MFKAPNHYGEFFATTITDLGLKLKSHFINDFLRSNEVTRGHPASFKVIDFINKSISLYSKLNEITALSGSRMTSNDAG